MEILSGRAVTTSPAAKHGFMIVVAWIKRRESGSRVEVRLDTGIPVDIYFDFLPGYMPHKAVCWLVSSREVI